jgi:hypothetical protein
LFFVRFREVFVMHFILLLILVRLATLVDFENDYFSLNVKVIKNVNNTKTLLFYSKILL